MGDAADEKAKRVKNLLSLYYANDAPEGGAAQQRKVTAIDSAAFDAEAYVANLVAKTRLDQLQSKYSHMTQEIRHLDSDMQNLVYENYSKFITATDTIRRMKANVEEMGGRMDELQTTVMATASASDTVNTKLSKHRAQIEDLNNIRSLLKKLQAVFGLPGRMKAALEIGALDAAVKEYAAALPLLERYGTGAFATVKAETASTVKDIGDRLRNTLRNAHTSPDDAAEALELLQMLKMPQDELQREWLSERRKALADAMRHAGEQFWAAHTREHARGQPGQPPAPRHSADVHDFVRHVDRGFLQELIKTVNQYKDLFPESRQALIGLARQSLGEFLAYLREVLSPTEGPLPPAKGLMAALAQMAADMASVARILPEARLDDRAAEMVEKSVRHHVIGLFQRLEESVAGNLAEALKQLPQPGRPGEAVTYRPLLQLQAQVCNELMEGLVKVLREVAALQDERPVLLASWRDVFADLVQGQAQMWFTGLTATIISAAGLPPMPEAARMMEALQASEQQRSTADPVPAPAAFLLFLLRVVSFLEDHGVEAVVDKLGHCFQLSFGAEGGQGDPHHQQHGATTFSRDAVQRLLRTAQSRILLGYVQQQGRKLSKLVRTSMAAPNWLSVKEPRDVRPVCDFILTELNVVESEVSQLMDTDPGPRGHGGHGGSSMGGGAGGRGAQPPADKSKAIARNVAKLFQEKLKIFDAVEQTRDAVLLGVLKVALKSWVECVRLVTLGRAGFQQLQLDVHYMRAPLRAYAAANADVVDSLLDEVSAAAADRSLEPVQLEPGTLDFILQNRRRQ